MLLGKAQQGIDGVADQVGGGLVAGVEEEDAVLLQFIIAEPSAVDRTGDQRRQHIVFPRPAPTLGDQVAQVGTEFGHRAIAGVQLFAGNRGLQRAQNA